MPNHITNRIIAKGNAFEVRDFFAAIASPESPIDFNKIIPQPANIFNGDLGEKEKEMCRREGRPNWYDWNIENWGTKWGAYAFDEFKKLNSYKQDSGLFFQTAWNDPEPIFKKLAEMFPGIMLLISYADEDTGSNTGRYVAFGGHLYIYEIENQTNEAYELAFELDPDSKQYYEFVDGEYKYNEDAE